MLLGSKSSLKATCLTDLPPDVCHCPCAHAVLSETAVVFDEHDVRGLKPEGQSHIPRTSIGQYTDMERTSPAISLSSRCNA